MLTKCHSGLEFVSYILLLFIFRSWTEELIRQKQLGGFPYAQRDCSFGAGNTFQAEDNTVWISVGKMHSCMTSVFMIPFETSSSTASHKSYKKQWIVRPLTFLSFTQLASSPSPVSSALFLSLSEVRAVLTEAWYKAAWLTLSHALFSTTIPKNRYS